MRFCPQCGAPLLAGAKFCVECGRALDAAASGAGESGGLAGGRNPITTTFVFVFVALAVVGLAAAAWIYVKTPDVVREQVASAPPVVPPDTGAPPSGPGTAQSGAGAAPNQNVSANPAAGGSQNGDMPPGHPTISLPTEARSFVDKIERDAIAKPKDVTAWNKFGAVSMLAAMFDQSYYCNAEGAYGHVLTV